MLDEPKKSKGIFDLSEELKETSIYRHYSKEKVMTKTLSRKDFLFCEPSEVIIQSKLVKKII